MRYILFTIAVVILFCTGCNKIENIFSREDTPIKIKGIYIGMDAKSAQEILNGFIQNPELSNWKLNPEYIKLTSNVWAERVDIFPSERSSFVRANADSHGRINQIEFNSPLAITEIFKSNGVSGQDFIKRYMDAYSIPEMQNVKNMTGMVDYQYLSPEGVRTYIRLFKNNYGEMIPLFIQITKVVSKREFIQNITME